MDVFYYWKGIEKDLEAGRVGRFKSSRAKLTELADGFPDYIWVFKTPKGRKGMVQLLAKLRWADKATIEFKVGPGQSYVFYDPAHEGSVRFTDSDSVGAIEDATSWVRRHFPTSVRGNFQGELGQLALRGPILKELTKLAEYLVPEPFALAGGTTNTSLHRVR